LRKFEKGASRGDFMTAQFTILIEQGEDGAYIATVPALKSCYTQAATIPELLEKQEKSSNYV
jgi:hypothetical protein